MFAAALIVFREVLEAALVVSIIMAATRGLARRGFWISLGITAGVGGAGLVALLTHYLSTAWDGAGQEIVNAVILFIAVLLISWHVIWMNSHGRRMAAEMRAIGHSVAKGEKHLFVLALVVGLAVMREGSEIVLMLQGLWMTGSTTALLGGMALGLAAGVSVGGLMYVGFLALPIHRMFTITNIFLVLIAAGMAARGANFLAQAGLISSLGGRVWDTSALLSDQSPVGQLLAALVGYIARPNGVEILFYAATVVIVSVLMALTPKHPHHKAQATVVLLVCLGAACLAMPSKAGEVLSPYVEQGELEFEQQGYLSHDRHPDNSNDQDYIVSAGYSPTSFWRSEVEGEFEREPGDGQQLRYHSVNSENTFQLAEAGEYWIDPGFFYEMDFAPPGQTNDIITGVLGAKTIGSVAETFNLLLHKDYGYGATPLGLIYSNQAKFRWHPWLEPGFEIFGDTDGKNKFADQQLGIGPGIFGKFHLFDGQELKYELGYLFGATQATADGAVRWKLEYEFFF